MGAEGRNVHELTREFFKYYPDYAFCRALAVNIKNNVTTYRNAIEMLARKSWTAEQNSGQIREKLDQRSVTINGQWVCIKDLSLRKIMDQPDNLLKEIADFYFKHPYAHGRTKRSRFLPRALRTLFLSILLGHAKRRGILLDYEAYFETLTLL